jgi:glycosyltransferase involved in cell wall biosynthesis
MWQIETQRQDFKWKYFTYTASRREISQVNPPDFTVTIVVTFHRTLNYAYEALESIKNQTRPPDQIIVVLSDLDSEIEIFRRIVSDLNFPQLEYLICRDGAAGENRNASLEFLKSDYVVFLDGDDFLTPMALEILIFNVSHEPKSVLGTDCIFYPTKRIFWVKRRVTSQLLENANQVNVTALIPTKMLKEIGGFRTSVIRTFHLPEDWDLWMRISRSGVEIFNITTPLFFYRQHSESTTSRQSVSTHFLEERWRPLIGIDNNQIWHSKSSFVNSHLNISQVQSKDIGPQEFDIEIVLADRFDQNLLESLHKLQSERSINYVICLDSSQDAYSYFFAEFGDQISFVSLSMSFINSHMALNYAAYLIQRAAIVHHINDHKLFRIMEKVKKD